MSNRVAHFEIPCENLEKSMNFFHEIFGWDFNQLGTEEYWFAATGDSKKTGINGGLIKKKNPQHPLVISIEVENIDQTMIRIKNLGGEIILEKMPIPTVGWIAYFKDLDNNIHQIFQEDPHVD